jgi:hypothetical protein
MRAESIPPARAESAVEGSIRAQRDELSKAIAMVDDCAREISSLQDSEARCIGDVLEIANHLVRSAASNLEANAGTCARRIQ